MKILKSLLLTAIVIGFVSGSAFANKTNWGIDGTHYKYALIEGKITSIDHVKKVITVDGANDKLFFDKHTTFYSGDISLPMEKVISPVNFTENQGINVTDVREGDVVKSRYEVMENGLIFLDACLVGNGAEPGNTTGEFLVAEK